MREYGRQQLENQHQLEARRNEIYRVIPAVRELEAEIASRSVAGAKRLLAGDTGALAELREELADLREAEGYFNSRQRISGGLSYASLQVPGL